MGENIDPTWIAWAAQGDQSSEHLGPRLELVRRHYAQLVDYPLDIQVAHAGDMGVATVGDAEPACRWPHFARDERHAIATAYVPTGWERIARSGAIADAPLALARSLGITPDDASRKLNAPAAIGMLELDVGRLTVVNDSLGAARAYEAEAGGVRAWSNRP